MNKIYSNILDILGLKRIYILFIFSFSFLLNITGQVVGDFRSKTAGSGNWNDYNAWEKFDGTIWKAAQSGEIPSSSASVEIKAGDAMVINGPALNSGNLTVNGSLTYHSTVSSTLTVTGSITVNNTGSFTSPNSGTVTDHFLNIGGASSLDAGGDLVVNGIFNMNIFPTAGVNVTFYGSSNNFITGTGTLNFYIIYIYKGSGNYNSVLEVLTTITMPNATVSVNTQKRLYLMNGTLKLTSALNISPYYGTFILNSPNGRLWLNNSGAVIQSVGAGTTALSGGTMEIDGMLQIDAGTFSFGAGNSFLNCQGNISMGGPTAILNIYGYMNSGSTSTYTMTDGNINIYPQVGANSVSASNPIFQFSGKSINFTGGTMTIVDPNPNTGNDIALDVKSGSCNFLGSTVRFGDGISDLNGKNGFLINTGNNLLGNVIVNNAAASTNPTRKVMLSANSGIAGNLTINPGAANQFILNGYTLNSKGNIQNDGNFNFDKVSSGLLFSGSTQQTIGGTGIFSANVDSLTINNTSGIVPSVDFQFPLTVTKGLTLSNGSPGSSNNSTFTLGNSGNSLNLSIKRSGGTLSLVPTYKLNNVAVDLTYNTPSPSAGIITGNELPPATQIAYLTINNPAGVILDKPVKCGSLVLSSGNLTTTSVNSITVNGTSAYAVVGNASSYVNGPFTRTIPNNASSGNYKFPVGKSAYRPFDFLSLTTSGSGTGTLTVEAFDAGTYPGIAGSGLSTVNTDKFWSLKAALGTVTIAPSSSIQITDAGLDVTNRISQSNTVNGTFNSIGGNVTGGTIISSVNPLDYSAIASGTFFRMGISQTFHAGLYAIGPKPAYAGYAGTYSKLTDAITAISFVPITGNLIFEFQNDYVPSVETYPINLNANIVNSSISTITFRLASNVNAIINFSNNGTVINNAGADYILFDGRNGGAGTNQYLQFTNTAITTTLPTVVLSKDALHDQFQYCILKGSTTTSGILTLNSPTSGNNFFTIDHCSINGNGSAANCLYTSGLATNVLITNNNFFDFRGGAGVNLVNGSDNAIIDHNNFYQTVPYQGFSGTTSGIIITGGNNVTISNNNIGGSGPGLTGIWSISASPPAAYNFTGINATSLATTGRIYNNKIQNFDWRSNVSTWTGINVSGSVNVGTDGANYVGNDTGNDNIKVTYYQAGAPQITGIQVSGAANIENNVVGSITSLLSGVTSTGASFTGISSTGTGIIHHNIIGSALTTRSINTAPQSVAGNAQNVYGIYSSSSNSFITNNTVANIYNGSTVTSGLTRGILLPNINSSVSIASNDIHSISTSQPVVTQGTLSSIDGINVQSASTSTVKITGNAIYDLVNTAAAAVCINGILYNSSIGTTNRIEKNYIHSFVTASNTAVQNGINLTAGSANVQNNVIRLGIDKDGNSITSTTQMNGIMKSSPSFPSNFYFNTVYIGGSGIAAGTVKTFAFNFAVKSYSAEEVRNNIFVNMRTNATPNKLNYALLLPSIGSYSWSEDYNIYQVSNTDGKFCLYNNSDQLNLKALQNAVLFTDLHSGIGDPLLNQPNAGLTTMDLRPLNNTPAEGTGIAVSGISDDITGAVRSSGTPTDIGAYSGNFSPATATQDIFPPVITYSPLGNGSSLSNRLTANFATITDNLTGISMTPGSKPRIYYKTTTNNNVFLGNTSSDNGWKWVEAIGTIPPYNFNIDYSLLYGSPVVKGSVIQYFVVAQDMAALPNVTFLPSSGASGTSVSPVGMTAPAIPNSYSIVSSLPAILNVGTGQTYPTLTGTGGAFEAINAGAISVNTAVVIKSNLTESGTTMLNEVSEEGPNTGKLTLTIQSDGSPYLISGLNLPLTTPLISVNGTKRLTIDGGTGKLLTFRNTNSLPANTYAVIKFDNNSQDCILQNCTIESNGSSVSLGAITLGNVGMNNITISRNDIRDARGSYTGSPLIGIYSYNSGNKLNIVNNNIYNLKNANSYGMYLYTVANGCTINGNSIFMESAFTDVPPFRGIFISNSGNHVISGNYIGGSAPMCGGASPFTISGSDIFTGINCNFTNDPAVIIQGNIIQNIKMTSTGTPVFVGIENDNGPVVITGNMIGSTSVPNSIQVAGTGSSVAIIQKSKAGSNSFTIEKNTVANISLTNVTGSPVFKALQTCGGTVRMNNVFTIGSFTPTLTPVIYGIYNAFGLSVNEFSNNSISLDGGLSTSASLTGFYEGSTSGITGFYYNSININGTASGDSASYAFNRAAAGTYKLNNNIFTNTRTGGKGIHYAFYSIPNDALASDYNDFYASGPTVAHWGVKGIANDIPNLNAWRTLTSLDANSINGDPLFTSLINLLPFNNSPVNGSGTPVTTVTTDYSGAQRNLNAPTIGCYELECVGPTMGGTISGDQTVIYSKIPSLITSQAEASGNSGKLEYKWQSSVFPFVTWTDISTTNSSTYQPGAITRSTRYKRLARTACLSGWTGAPESNEVTMTLEANKWKGTLNNDWNDPGNWTFNLVPDSCDLVFDDSALKDCRMDRDRTINDLILNKPPYRLITNGKNLTIKGNLNLTNGAQIESSIPGSTVLFSGNSTQTIPADAFVNNKVYNLTINNPKNVVLNGSMNVLNSCTAVSGRLDAVANSPTVIYGGTEAQHINSSVFLQDKVSNLIIDNAAGVSLDSDFTVVHLLTINPGKQLIIPTSKLLNVEGTINNISSSGLVLKASPTGDVPNGSLIFHNASTTETPVQATVEMYTKAALMDGHYKWQFFGIPLKTVQANPTFAGSYVREMHENVTGTTGHWVQLQNESVLNSFTGYEITQEAGKVIRFEGNLENADYGPVHLSYTEGATYAGQHLIGNPYTAAITIRNDIQPANSLTFGDGMIKTVYLYNTGSYNDWWNNGLSGGGNNNAAGQYLAVPQENAGKDLLPSSIPSMQAFLVMVNTPGDGATISIPYSSTGTVVKNTTVQRAPAAEMVSTRIDINGVTAGDRMWVFIVPGCTRGFDNGWDGYKMMGSVVAPQIYAMEDEGNFQVNSVDDLNNTFLGFRTGTDTTYTITFTHQNIETVYQNIYLIDLTENVSTEVTVTGSHYTFHSNSGTPLEKRFKIIAKTKDSDITTNLKTPVAGVHSLSVFNSKNTILVKNQSDLKGDLFLYDISGRFIQKMSFNAGTITAFPLKLPSGSYLTRAVNREDEVTTKLILQE